MAVKFRKGRWEVDRKWKDGTRYRKRMPSQEHAEKIDLRIRVSNFDGTWRKLRTRLTEGPRQILTFNKFSEIYLRDYVQSHNRSSVSKDCRIAILNLKFSSLRLDAIGPRDLSAFERERRLKVSNATINRDVTVLKHMLRWGARNGYVSRRRIEWVEEIEKLEERTDERPGVSEEIFNEIFAKLSPTVIPLFTFIRHTGCRRAEGLSLKWSQVEGEKVTFQATQTKSGKSRSVPLDREALSSIEAMPRCSEFVFYHPVSLTRWNECRKPWIKARNAAKHPWVLIKDLRRAFAIRLAESGCDMHFIQQVLGHASLSTTEKYYAKFSPESAVNQVREHLRLIAGGKSGN